MNLVDSKFDNLREKLDILGYTQTLPLSAVPLVGVLFEDLIKTTESLRNAKLEVAKYLEEKHCWELGVEPYKCDNSRLLSECNSIHLELIKTQDEFEEKICDYRQKIRNLEADKQHLDEHCAQLEKNVRDLLMKASGGGSKSSKNDVNMSRKPFVSTVKSGSYVPNPSEPANAYRCVKCCSVVWTRHLDGKLQEVQLLQNGIQTQADQITSLKEKVERRDREINRLNHLLTGGRPVEALAKDCCYKNVGTLSEDVEDLQKEKVDLVKKCRDAQNGMHEAMKRAIGLEQKNRQIERELEDFQEKALSVESEANIELEKKESEICALKKTLEKERNVLDKDCGKASEEKRRLYEQLNAITQREKQLLNELERVKKKNIKLKQKMTQTQKDSTDINGMSQTTAHYEEEIKRIRSEREFFQKEYLKIVEQSTSNKDLQMLKSQLESKDHELTTLTKELIQLRYQSSRLPEEKYSTTPYSVQAAITRVERERDILKEELRLLSGERDRLREKLDCVQETQLMERCRIEEANQLLHAKISKLESEKRELMAQHIPERTQLTLIKEELEEMKRRVHEVQGENHKLSTTNNQLRILQDQTEKALIDHQTKLLAAETNLENAECQLSTINTTRDDVRSEAHKLKREIAVLKSNYKSLEIEKDKITSELDTKTEKVYELENEIKVVKRDHQDAHCKVKALEKALSDTVNQKQEYQSELHETSTESKSMRDKISALKLTQDQQLAENCRLINDLAETTADLRQFKQKLKDSEKEVDRLKQQLQQYVQEVKRVEECLASKEHEREEMLDHYRSLSHDAVQLEGNNQSLEIEAAEHKQQLCDAQSKLCNLKKELVAKDECISKLENQVSVLSSQISETQAELNQNYDELRLTKVDLGASQELIAKLDVQRAKLNAELKESKNIRCQLEKELKELQERIMDIDSHGRTHLGTLEDLLSTTRKELDMQRKRTSHLNQEVMHLRKTIKELEEKISLERTKCLQNETLAKEYSIKIQELQQSLTNNRFHEARSQEDSARSYSICPYNSRIARQSADEINSMPEPDKLENWKASARAFMLWFIGITENLTADEKHALKRFITEFLNSESDDVECTFSEIKHESFDYRDAANLSIYEDRSTKLELFQAQVDILHSPDGGKQKDCSEPVPTTPAKFLYVKNTKEKHSSAFHVPITPRSQNPRTDCDCNSGLKKTPECAYSRGQETKLETMRSNAQRLFKTKLRFNADLKSPKPLSVSPRRKKVEPMGASSIQNDYTNIHYNKEANKNNASLKKASTQYKNQNRSSTNAVIPKSPTAEGIHRTEKDSDSVIPILESVPVVELIDTGPGSASKNLRFKDCIQERRAEAEEAHRFKSQVDVEVNTGILNRAGKMESPNVEENVRDPNANSTSISAEMATTYNQICLPHTSTTTCCSCMKEKKYHIMALCNISSNQKDDNVKTESVNCSTSNEHNTESSSCHEGRNSARKSKSKLRRRKRLDLSKLPPPPPLVHRKN